MTVSNAEAVSDESSTSSRNGMEGEPGLDTFVTALSKSTEYLPLRTVPVILKNGNKSVRINALLDDGSTRSYINEDVAECLGLEGEPLSLCVRLLNDTTANLRSPSVQVHLESCNGHASAKFTGLSLNDVLHQGLKLQNDLVDVLVRFRQSPIAQECDITEMYL